MSKEKGYSAYVFSTDAPSDYCVIDQEEAYAKLRLYANVGSMILSITIMIASPLTLVAVYDFACKNLKGNSIFIAWSLMFVSGIAACLMFVYDGFTIGYNIILYPSSPKGVGFHDIFIYFIVFAVFLGVLLLGDLFLMICALMYLQPSQHQRFPTPELFKFFKTIFSKICFCCRPQAEADLQQGWRKKLRESCCSECLVLLFGMVYFTLFMELASFHLLYMLLGAISTPVETLSIATSTLLAISVLLHW